MGVEPVGVGVIGLGFMGRIHVEAYRGAGARLVAVCDGAPARLRGEAGAQGNIDGGSAPARLFDPAKVHATPDLDAFLATPSLDLVSVCTPTDTHAEIAGRVIDAGKHLIIEKPVALEAGTVAALGEHAAAAGVLCMPAMCMRFWPAWAWVKDAIDDGRLGALRAVRLERLGARPTWGAGFYDDESRSGGALFDLHVHDTDFLVHALGAPESVRSVGDAAHVSTVYAYGAGGPRHVTAQGGWLRGPGWGFSMRMITEFESGVADFELGRTPELRVHLASGETEAPSLAPGTGWDHEIAAMVEAVGTRAQAPPATMGSAATSTRVLEAERESLRHGRAVPVDREPGE